jgi:hypothetical protein
MTAAPMIHIIEDDSGLRNALTLLLQGDGFDVRAYPSAEAFLSELDRLQPICLLTDLRLPAMDGLTLYRHLIKLGLEPAISFRSAQPLPAPCPDGLYGHTGTGKRGVLGTPGDRSAGGWRLSRFRNLGRRGQGFGDGMNAALANRGLARGYAKSGSP